jgi:heat shock protein beta
MFYKFDRLMKAQTLGDTSSLEFMRGRRIFEINPDHPIIKDISVRFSFTVLSVKSSRI